MSSQNVNGTWQVRSNRLSKDVDELWRKYKAEPTEGLRNELLEYYLPTVRYHAARVCKFLFGKVDTDDLVADGLFGLVSAIESFDLERGIKFKTYCAFRIRGAMLDGLRDMDWAPRLVRSRTFKVDTVRQEYFKQYGVEPTEEQIVSLLGVSSDEYQLIQRDALTVQQQGLDMLFFETDSGKGVLTPDLIEDRRQEDPANVVNLRIIKEILMRGLDYRERIIITLYYFEGLSMKEVGEVVDLSVPRVSQIHANLILRIKARFTARDGRLEPVTQ